MLSNNFFIFKRNDGLEVSSMELGSIVAKPSISRAKRVIKHISIEGRDSTLTEDTGVYNNTEISFQLINFKENLLEKEILGFLDGSGGQLKLSWLQGWFKVKEVNQFLITEEKGHNPNYTKEAVRLKKIMQNEIKEHAFDGMLADEAFCKEFLNSHDWEKITEQDNEVWGKIFEFLEK